MSPERTVVRPASHAGDGAESPAQLTVGDLATRDVVSIAPHRTLRDAARIMDEHGIGAIIVLEGDDGPSLAGILSERDLLHAMAIEVDPDTATVADHMTHEVITAETGWAVYEGAAAMTDNHIRHLVVTDGPRVYGVLSVRDVLLSGQRIELTGGHWAILRDPLTFTIRERRRLQRQLLGLDRGPTGQINLDAVTAELIGSWSYADPPAEDAVSALDPESHATLRDAVEQELPSLQRAVHPAPGWRQWGE